MDRVTMVDQSLFRPSDCCHCLWRDSERYTPLPTIELAYRTTIDGNILADIC